MKIQLVSYVCAGLVYNRIHVYPRAFTNLRAHSIVFEVMRAVADTLCFWLSAVAQLRTPPYLLDLSSIRNSIGRPELTTDRKNGTDCYAMSPVVFCGTSLAKAKKLFNAPTCTNHFEVPAHCCTPTSSKSYTSQIQNLNCCENLGKRGQQTVR